MIDIITTKKYGIVDKYNAQTGNGLVLSEGDYIKFNLIIFFANRTPHFYPKLGEQVELIYNEDGELVSVYAINQ